MEMVLDKCMVKQHIIKGKVVDPKRAKSRPICKKIFVGGIDASLTEEQIREYFSRYGKVDGIELPKDRLNQRRREFCFVIFETEDVAEAAARQPRQVIGNKECDIKRAQPQPMAAQQKRLASVAGLDMSGAATLSKLLNRGGRIMPVNNGTSALSLPTILAALQHGSGGHSSNFLDTRQLLMNASYAMQAANPQAMSNPFFGNPCFVPPLSQPNFHSSPSFSSSSSSTHPLTAYYQTHQLHAALTTSTTPPAMPVPPALTAVQLQGLYSGHLGAMAASNNNNSMAYAQCLPASATGTANGTNLTECGLASSEVQSASTSSNPSTLSLMQQFNNAQNGN